ncbi:MAG: HDOD domain-containing protein [Deltaproteobacteria bacterium]|nr:HDOD domain-containing protein [Deltaproteobacteria bacterium]
MSNLGKALRPIIEKKIEDGTLRLPALQASAMRIMELMRKEDLDPRAVARALEKDPLLAAQVVRAANTVAFRGGMAVTNLNQAVVRLGSRQLRSFLLTAVALQLFVTKDRELDFAMKMLRSHSVAVSLLARDLAQLTRCEEVEEAYLAGLLHDIGKVIVMIFVLEIVKTQKPARQTVRIRQEDYVSAMQQLHRPIGAKIIQQWELPLYLQQVIQDSNAYTLNQRVSPGNLVCFANAMTKKMKIYLGESNPYEVVANTLIGRSVLGIDEEVVDRLCSGLEERVKDI